MNLEELWIGDRLLVRSLNQIGQFEGISPKGLAIVKMKASVIQVESKFLSLAKEEIKEIDLGLGHDEEVQSSLNKGLESSLQKAQIDLHIEILNPSLKNARVERILQYQIEQCHFFVSEAIHRMKHSVLIIHGRGEGVLKMEVEHLLQHFKEVHHVIKVNNEGAVQVMFNYN